MRELDIAIIGAGRLGTALAAALGTAPPLGRGSDPSDAGVVLLCVPDAEIEAAARAVSPGPLVGHCSGATTLEPLLAAGHEAFSLHPLMTVPLDGAARFAGAGAAVAGSSERAMSVSRELAERLGMTPVEIADGDRAAYHAAAAIASNFLTTIEGAAERLGATAGLSREQLVPLVRASVEAWATLGAEHALTGPIARGDEATVERHRHAIAERTPDLLPLYDTLAAATRALAEPRKPATGSGELRQFGSDHRNRNDEVGGGRNHADALRTVRTVAELRELLSPHRSAGRTVGLVPTMGALHAGHESLVAQAREENDVVVVSLFVNPAQFDEAADLEAYPRTEAADAEILERLGADILFAPDADTVYPAGFATTVHVAGLGDTLEGEHRPGHFDGVATVVAKLLNMVAPTAAYFGQKDAQQAALIRRLARDLDIPARIEVRPTVREPDGLALSSRNVRLSASERERATALHDALATARATIASGERDAGAIRAAAERTMRERGVEPEYLALVDPDTFSPVDTVNGRVLVAVAARVGETRLIDNDVITTTGAPLT